MQLELTEEQAFFADTTRRFLESETPLTTVRALYETPEGFDRTWWSKAAELGWTSLFVPESLGGGSLSGGPTRDAVIVAEEMGRLVAPGPFQAVNVVAAALAWSGTDAQRAEVLPGLVSGQTLATWAHCEPGGRWRPEELTTTAVVDGGEVVLTGEKAYAESAASADHLLVSARSDDGPLQVLVPAGTPGMTVVGGRSIDITRRFGRVLLDGARLPADAVVGEAGGLEALRRQLLLALALQCAELVGVADRTLEFTLAYGADRFAFGRPVVSYQALKHRVADMTVWLEGSKAVTDDLALAIDEQRADGLSLGSVAKAYVGEHCPDIVDDCVQMTGGIGVTWEHDIHLYNRRAALDRALYGSPEEHKSRLVAHDFERKPEMVDDTALESIEDFVARARPFIEANLPGLDDPPADARELQNLLFDHGFAGIGFPARYGGAGLTLEHQKAFFVTAAELRRQVPTNGVTYRVSIGMLGPTLLEQGSEEAKLRFLPPLLRGDEVWIQLLSEPRGGSDMAGAITRLTRDGDTYVLNGAKMWSTGAHTADFGLCLCRTNWDVPKHRGLSTIAVPLSGTPGVTIQQIRAVDGRLGEFCQEFFDDMRLPVANLIGEENHGWGVAQTLLLHERNAVGNIGFGYLSSALGEGAGEPRTSASGLIDAARARGVDEALGAQLADAYIEGVVGPLTSARIALGNRIGTHRGQWGSLSKLQHSLWVHETARTALAALGPDGVIWDGDEVQYDNAGTAWLGSRSQTIAGGTNEMQRNIISERLLGLPREPTSDRDVPFNELLRGTGKG